MSCRPLRITYIGGGSRFVVTLLHGLAGVRGQLAACGRSIELRLMDPDLARACQMSRYAAIVRTQTGLPVSAVTTTDIHAAVDATDCVIYSPGLWRAYGPLSEAVLGVRACEDSGPGCAMEASLAWPQLLNLGAHMQQAAPDALFLTLVNPTDVLAPAFERAFGIRSLGVCVEVPQLRRWLAYHTERRVDQVSVGHIGLNHFGWVTTLAVEDLPDVAAALERRRATDAFDPQNDFFLDILGSTGLMRSGSYHPWPFTRRLPCDAASRRARFSAFTGHGHDAHMAAQLEHAMAEHRMVPEDENAPVTRWLHPYAYCTTRHTLAAIALSLAGGDGGMVPLQLRNGDAYPWLPSEAWIECPARCHAGTFAPAPGPTLPDWAARQLATIATQRHMIADWLATRIPRTLVEALLLWPEPIPLDRLAALPAALASLDTLTQGALP